MDPKDMIDLVAAKLHEQTRTTRDRFDELDDASQGAYRQHVSLTLDALYAAGFIVGRREVA